MPGTVTLLPAHEHSTTGPQQPADHPTPGLSRLEHRSLAAELAAYSIPVFLPTDPPPLAADPGERERNVHWVAHVSVEITRHKPRSPLLLVARGAATSRLCALGFAQKASRHPVSGYVIIDGPLPETRQADWPDAPVDIVLTPEADDTARQAARVAELRGWTCHFDADPAAVIRQLIRG